MNAQIKKLLSQRDEQWRFPGTVHDTFEALTAIALHDRTLLQGEPLGKIASLLISIEYSPGGPYYSHFSEGDNRVCDRKTNEAIASFLSIYNIQLPNLNKFLRIKKIQSHHTNSLVRKCGTFTISETAIMKKIRAQLRKRLANFDPEFRKRTIEVVERTIRGNPDKQMPLMPYYMICALGENEKHISENMIVSMCLHNIFFWTSFIIYDDFWDEDEAADPKLLPVANFLARSYVDFFSTLFTANSEFHSFFHELMNKLDAANAWETAKCRMKRKGNIVEVPQELPNYGDYLFKFYPPSGHIFGPVAILLLSGHTLHSKEVKNLIKYFTHYLIAMQINDDMHDWEEDLRRGHISTVVDMLLRDMHIQKKDKKKPINLDTDLSELRRLFWFTTLPKMAKLALTHTKKSEQALDAMKSIENPLPLQYFIDFNQKIAKKALAEQKESAQFIHAYGRAHTSRRTR